MADMDGGDPEELDYGLKLMDGCWLLLTAFCHYETGIGACMMVMEEE
jgi:hypothetical protein